MSASFAASAFVAVTQILTRFDIPPCLNAALVCFAVSIPVLAAFSVQPPIVFPRDGRYTLLRIVRVGAFIARDTRLRSRSVPLLLSLLAAHRFPVFALYDPEFCLRATPSVRI